MDANHIVGFLNSMGERGMAEEVTAMHNRLEAFASGLDRDTFDAMERVAKEALRQRDELQNALAFAREKIAELHTEAGDGDCHYPIIDDAILKESK